MGTRWQASLTFRKSASRAFGAEQRQDFLGDADAVDETDVDAH